MTNQKIDLKNTKAEIFEAFNKLKEDYKKLEKEKVSPAQAEIKKKEEEKIIKKTAELGPDNLENEIRELSKNISKRLEGITSSLTEESVKLQEIREAKKIEERKLKEIYDIELGADALKTLIADFEQKQKEMSEVKAKTEYELNREIEAQKRSWEREKEEYNYNLKTERRREEAEYEAKQAEKRRQWSQEVEAKQKELDQREEAIATKEEEMENMRAKIENFPQTLEKAVGEAKKHKENNLRREFEIEKKMAEQKNNAEINVLHVKISSLKETLASRDQEIKSLKDSLSQANERTQSLAVAVVGADRKKEESENREKNRPAIDKNE